MRYVLIAEDEGVLRELLGFAAEEMAGRKARAYPTGTEALADLKGNLGSVGLLITDLRMPREGDGVALVRGAREAGYQGPVLATSGAYSPAEREAVEGLGADFIPKPWLPLQIAEYIQRRFQDGPGPSEAPHGA